MSNEGSNIIIEGLEENFATVWEALDLKEQRKALRGAMRREGGRLRKQAIQNLRASGIGQGTRQKLSKGIYVRVYPDKYGAGFMVSVTPHGKRGIHKNRQGLEKPVLMWAEDGSRSRRVGKRKKSFFYTSKRTGKKQRAYLRSGHSTGVMKRYAFLEKTEAQTAQTVEQNLFSDFQQNLNKAFSKKGLLS